MDLDNKRLEVKGLKLSPARFNITIFTPCTKECLFNTEHESTVLEIRVVEQQDRISVYF